MLGPTGLSSLISQTSKSLHKAQTGSLYHYTLIILFGLTVLVCYKSFLTFFLNDQFLASFILILITCTLLANERK